MSWIKVVMLLLVGHHPKHEQYHHQQTKFALPMVVQINIMRKNCIVSKTIKGHGSYLQQLTFTKMMYIDDQFFAINQAMYLLLTFDTMTTA